MAKGETTDIYDRMIYKLRIKEILRERGLTQSWLANEMGTSSANLSSCISGNVFMSMSKMIEMARILDVELCDLFERTGWCTGSLDPSGQYAQEPGKVLFVYKSSDEEHFELTDKEIERVALRLGVDVNMAKAVLVGDVAVSPMQYAEIAYILGVKAYQVMPNVRVSHNTKTYNCLRGLLKSNNML